MRAEPVQIRNSIDREFAAAPLFVIPSGVEESLDISLSVRSAR
jgi:hypothetical protein